VVTVELNDGAIAELRPVVPADRGLVAAGFDQLSMAGRIARFGMAVDHLTETELTYLTEVDQVRHVAWGARVDGEPAAIARYVVVPDGSCAEVAVAVVDEYQRRGLGRALLSALVASARHNGVERFCFIVDAANRHVLTLAGGATMDLIEQGGTIQGVVDVSDLPGAERGSDFVELLTAVQAVRPRMFPEDRVPPS
jgi:GNAT superfamily N-acetyltransferase